MKQTIAHDITSRFTLPGYFNINLRLGYKYFFIDLKGSPLGTKLETFWVGERPPNDSNAKPPYWMKKLAEHSGEQNSVPERANGLQVEGGWEEGRGDGEKEKCSFVEPVHWTNGSSEWYGRFNVD